MLAAVAVGLLVLVVALTVPGLVADEEPAAAPRSSACVVRATAPTDEIGAQEAEWVRFCPLASEGDAQRVRHPAGVVTGDLAVAVAATLWQTQDGRRVCAVDGGPTAGPARRFRIEVGLADGRIAELAGDTGCSTRDTTLFSQLETTLLMDAAGQAPADPLPDPVRCPRRFTTTATNAADAIRAAATIGYTDGVADCAPDPDATSYVVVLGDRTGTMRTLAIDTTACGTLQAALGLPATETYLALASPRLVRMIAQPSTSTSGT